jgi:hypothetical protein
MADFYQSIFVPYISSRTYFFDVPFDYTIFKKKKTKLNSDPTPNIKNIIDTPTD